MVLKKIIHQIRKLCLCIKYNIFLEHDKPEPDMLLDELDGIVHSDVGTNAVDLSDVAPSSSMASLSGIIFFWIPKLNYLWTPSCIALLLISIVIVLVLLAT